MKNKKEINKLLFYKKNSLMEYHKKGNEINVVSEKYKNPINYCDDF